MNKIVVGSAPSPNLMSAQSRIGSLANTQHRVSGFDDSFIIIKYRVLQNVWQTLEAYN